MARAKQIGFAVVGLGALARMAILPAFARVKDARLVALVSREKKKAARLAARHRVPAFYTNDEFATCLANPAVFAVYIATPPGAHEEFAVAAARAGKHVLCEKPLAATPGQSARMVEACRQNGVLLMTAYRKYFEPSCLYLRQLIRSGRLGRIDTIHTSFSELFVPGKSIPWLLDPRLSGGGPLMDLGVYCVNTTRWLVGENPVEVSAQSWTLRPEIFREVEEGISFRLRFPSGLVVHASSTYSAALSSFILVQGTKGCMSLAPAYPFDEIRLLSGKIGNRFVKRRFAILDEFALEIAAFASAIRGGTSVAPDGAEGHRDMIILHAIYDSARRQAPVSIVY
jgi:predicted dehydrogenase